MVIVGSSPKLSLLLFGRKELRAKSHSSCNSAEVYSFCVILV